MSFGSGARIDRGVLPLSGWEWETLVPTWAATCFGDRPSYCPASQGWSSFHRCRFVMGKMVALVLPPEILGSAPFGAQGHKADCISDTATVLLSVRDRILSTVF
jgi:hypothetical protein